MKHAMNHTKNPTVNYAGLALLGLVGLSLSAEAALAQSRALILNEFNAVGDTQFLENDDEAFEGFDHGAIMDLTAYAGPARAGRIRGNGGNWVELVVTQDRLDLRGYKFEWDNTDPDQGSFTFSTNPLWASVRSGTIITVIENGLQIPFFEDGSNGPILNLGTDVSFNPSLDDWWINVDVDDSTYLSQTGFKVDNDNWRGRILDASGTVVQNYIGEAVPGWGGSGINNQEVGILEADPNNQVTGLLYNDRDYSTLGAPNLTDPTNQAAVFDELVPQDFDPLRGWWINRIPGDANVDGDVDFTDLSILAQNYGATEGRTWFEADFNGDGAVGFADLSVLAQNYGFQSIVLDESSGYSAEFIADWNRALALVPEPASLAFAVSGVAVLSRRVRRRR
jgi:hypothetical protein